MKTFTLLTGFLMLCMATMAQQPRYWPSRSHDEFYLKAAAERLPALYKNGYYDSIAAYIGTIAKTTNSIFTFGTRILVNIQLNRFDISRLENPDFLDTLQRYAYEVRLSQATTPPVGNEPGTRLEDMPYEDRLFLFNTVWARLLTGTRQLDSSQVLLCNIIEGKVQNPMADIRQKRKLYPALDSLFTKRAIIVRNSVRGNFAYSFGMWAPQGNAVRLGVHPSAGLLLGGRNKLNEYNINISLRFGRTPQDYTVLRNNVLYNRHFYEGGYGGFEYTRYLYHSLYFEAGITGGIGYDSFDIANDKDDNSNDYLKPLEMGSLNLNAGFRINFFLNPRLYLGMDGKFNYVDYKNRGGSPVDGNAYTITMFFGHN